MNATEAAARIDSLIADARHLENINPEFHQAALDLDEAASLLETGDTAGALELLKACAEATILTAKRGLFISAAAAVELVDA
ncbi:hypothetical protein [Aeromicrobium sp. Leaf291]|uniref:hypothetical protein n=1 Tax=Aeromicrobium sp. Leaf291 TaxID=1736325 RepID=UPI0007018954|nr:hypothetical protein [Aeromicrobium sp. Leaf291]KQP81603.1 hypothetical protein ASF35_16360 [Aeromicrobium sp. Leaf291]